MTSPSHLSISLLAIYMHACARTACRSRSTVVQAPAYTILSIAEVDTFVRPKFLVNRLHTPAYVQRCFCYSSINILRFPELPTPGIPGLSDNGVVSQLPELTAPLLNRKRKKNTLPAIHVRPYLLHAPQPKSRSYYLLMSSCRSIN